MSHEKQTGMRRRTSIGLGLTIFGFVVFLLGAEPSFFNLDRSPVIGFLQIAVFLIGLAIICIGGFISLSSLWNGHQKTIAADIGLRLVATGYVIAVTSGMADVFGFGNQPWPLIPYFGPWQAAGVMVGELVIALGFLLMIPPRMLYKKVRQATKKNGSQPTSLHSS
ncbi:MAG: hypothetical protein JW862_09980 [Anaerolineales bacterium]|nr:hypothetical protein [Anaerolineales bacterium]